MIGVEVWYEEEQDNEMISCIGGEEQDEEEQDEEEQDEEEQDMEVIRRIGGDLQDVEVKDEVVQRRIGRMRIGFGNEAKDRRKIGEDLDDNEYELRC